MSDFESMPIGTGAELARLNDLVRELAEALESLVEPTDKKSKQYAQVLFFGAQLAAARNVLKKVGR